MSKRKQIRGDTITKEAKRAAEAEDSGSDEDFDMLDVEFEWFDPSPDIDFHGIKSLLQQLLDVDNQLFDISALTDLILSQPLLGSTVKVDGIETDPYAFLSVINVQTHKDKPFVANLMRYLVGRANSNPAHAQLAQLLSQPDVPPVGLVLTDRLINVPSEVSPPMYTMLMEEIQWALEEKEPYTFSHYLILSKTYTEVASKLDLEDDRPKKKKKASGESDTFYFHPEDEVFQRHAVSSGSFDYTTKQDAGASDSKRAFQELGIRPQGHMILIEASKFEAAVKDAAAYLAPPS